MFVTCYATKCKRMLTIVNEQQWLLYIKQFVTEIIQGIAEIK